MSGDHVNSASDARVVNNVVRHEYRVLSDAEKGMMKDIKDQGLIFMNLISLIPATCETSIAKTKIEEAVMWAVKSITA